MTYGYFGSTKTQPGHRDEVLAILLSGADHLRAAGCSLSWAVSACSSG